MNNNMNQSGMNELQSQMCEKLQKMEVPRELFGKFKDATGGVVGYDKISRALSYHNPISLQCTPELYLELSKIGFSTFSINMLQFNNIIQAICATTPEQMGMSTIDWAKMRVSMEGVIKEYDAITNPIVQELAKEIKSKMDAKAAISHGGLKKLITK